uniref:Uncharacterized protein n=1 Tax=Cucumis sativus TaxID=3659 RepID=A0A0A0K4U2_CUCSA
MCLNAEKFVPISQLTSAGKFVVFGPNGVKVYQDLEASGKLLMERQEMDSIYIMLAEDAYMDMQRHLVTECIDSTDEQCHTINEALSWKALDSEKTPKDERSFEEGSKDEISRV